VGPSEETLMVLIFPPSHVETTPMSINCMYDVTFSPDFAVLIVVAHTLSAKKRNFPLYCIIFYRIDRKFGTK
ncbi:MAG: hypothetical protein MJE68_29305, partial [Proteobacteria bacterium]|nr:hypothetical protein [Pseudomonadota bacterium]